MNTLNSTIDREGSQAKPGGWTWPLWATIAGVFGVVATLISEQTIDEDVRGSGAAVIAELNHVNFHVGIITGLIATFAILAFAAGWHRWSEYVCKESLAARLVTLALTASAGAMIIGYGFKGSLAVYLDGGMDEGSYPAENLLVIFMINDFAPWDVLVGRDHGVAWHSLACVPRIGSAKVDRNRGRPDFRLPNWIRGPAGPPAVIAVK